MAKPEPMNVEVSLDLTKITEDMKAVTEVMKIMLEAMENLTEAVRNLMLASEAYREANRPLSETEELRCNGMETNGRRCPGTRVGGTPFCPMHKEEAEAKSYAKSKHDPTCLDKGHEDDDGDHRECDPNLCTIAEARAFGKWCAHDGAKCHHACGGGCFRAERGYGTLSKQAKTCNHESAEVERTDKGGNPTVGPYFCALPPAHAHVYHVYGDVIWPADGGDPTPLHMPSVAETIMGRAWDTHEAMERR